jgi:hypothetical protein
MDCVGLEFRLAHGLSRLIGAFADSLQLPGHLVDLATAITYISVI